MRGKWLVLAAVLLCCTVLTTGCLSPQERADLQADAEGIRAQVERAVSNMNETTATISDAIEAIKSGNMDAEKGSAVIRAAELQMSHWKQEATEGREVYGRIRERLDGKSPWEVGEGLLYMLITAVTGAVGGAGVTRYSRGPSSRAYKNPDGTFRG